MTRAKDISKIITDADFSGTLDVAGNLTVSTGVNSSTRTFLVDNAHSGGSMYNSFGVFVGATDRLVTLSADYGDSIMAFQTNNSERMRITNSGNVGIGISSPDTTTQISKSTTSTDGSVYPTLKIENTSAGTGNSYARFQVNGGNGTTTFTLLADGRSSNSDVSLRTNTSTPMSFYTNGSERMRIDSSGKVGIGSTSAGLHQVAVFGATGGNATFKAANTSTSGNTTCIIAFMDGSGSASSNSAFLQGFNGVTSYYLLGNGTHTFTSDENVKKNIETTRDGYLEDLARLRVVKYNWKHEEDGANKELGLIAQEVEEVFPNLVMEDFDPQIEEGQRRNKMIKTTVLPFMLLKALQEATTKIEALEIANTALEARITALETA